MDTLQDILKMYTHLNANVDYIFEDLIDKPWGRVTHKTWNPSIDIHETTDAFEIYADVPGMKLSDIEIKKEGLAIYLAGKRPIGLETGKRFFIKTERPRGLFCRRIELNENIDFNRIEKNIVDGVLLIKIPKI